METFVGLDVSLKETSVCVLNQAGTLFSRAKSHRARGYRSADTQARDQRRASCLESGPTSVWLTHALSAEGLPSSVSMRGMRKAVLSVGPTNPIAATPAGWPRWFVSVGSKRCRSRA